MKPDTHFCLVSAQPLPNALPALDPNLGARRVVLATTPDMTRRAEWLESVFRPRPVKVDHLPLDDAWNYDHVQTRVMEFLEEEKKAGRLDGIALNATGGTKLMSVAAYEAFRAYRLPVFYVHPVRDEVIWLQPCGLPPHRLADRIRIEPFLELHGARVASTPRRSVPRAEALQLAENLVQAAPKYTRAIGRLNYLTSQLRSPGLVIDLDDPDPELDSLIDQFGAAGYLSRIDDRHIRFRDEESVAFINGRWIEAWVFDQVRKIREHDPVIQDVAYDINVERQQRGRPVPNELDVVVLRNNRLHIIECKTRRFREQGAESAGAEALYKLDSLRDLMGGLQARAMLVSYRDLPGHDRTRAADLGIAVCAGEQLRRLHQHLVEFFRD